MTAVILQCVKEKSRLRVKIISNGYNNDANCQFPKAIRKEGLKYKVPPEAIKVVQRTGKFFYHVDKSLIEILTEDTNIGQIYTSENCCICLDEECGMVMVPCGHLCLCDGCSIQYKDNKCPMCRSNILARIDKSKLQ